MEIPYFLVNAFATSRYSGSPAAICLPRELPSKETLAGVAADLGVPDTAFLFRSGEAYHIRWFTPAGELALCAHATLAAAHVVLCHLEPSRSAVTFGSAGGPIHLARRGELLVTDFPRLMPTPADAPEALFRALGPRPREVLRAGKFIVVYEHEDEVRGLTPDLGVLATVDSAGVIATARGKSCDFVVRSFAIGGGHAIEETVSGSAETRLVPYWANVLKKNELHVLQASARGAELFCEDNDGRVYIAGRAILSAQGTVFA